jgi:hypothetical protein
MNVIGGFGVVVIILIVVITTMVDWRESGSAEVEIRRCWIANLDNASDDSGGWE